MSSITELVVPWIKAAIEIKSVYQDEFDFDKNLKLSASKQECRDAIMSYSLHAIPILVDVYAIYNDKGFLPASEKFIYDFFINSLFYKNSSGTSIGGGNGILAVTCLVGNMISYETIQGKIINLMKNYALSIGPIAILQAVDKGLALSNAMSSTVFYINGLFSNEPIDEYYVIIKDKGDIDKDGDGLTPNQGDCDDNNPSIAGPSTWYADSDIDGYGNPNISTSACTQPIGYVANNTDCNDNAFSVNSGVPEIIGNNIDDNCNGQFDEGGIMDVDGDGVADGADNCPNTPVGENVNTDGCSQSQLSNVSSPLNDTGITWGGNYPSGNNTTCTSNIAGAQDCNQGRDATHNDNSDGYAGFSFTKLDGNGNDLPASATQWSCVRDNVTGLVWEVKTDDGGIHDKDNMYRWGGKTTLGSGYGTYFSDWDPLVDGSNNEGFCGYNDWRVPTRQELHGIVHYGVVDPAIDTNYFPNTPAASFWSASSGYANLAWQVGFSNGGSNSHERFAKYRVRLVRSEQ